MTEKPVRPKCGRTARIWATYEIKVVQCNLYLDAHYTDENHRDAIEGDWGEVEELDERYIKTQAELDDFLGESGE